MNADAASEKSWMREPQCMGPNASDERMFAISTNLHLGKYPFQTQTPNPSSSPH